MIELLQQITGVAFMMIILPACSVDSSCDIVSFQHCVNQLADYKRRSEGGLIVYQENDLDEVCRTFDDISVCVKRATSTCSDADHADLTKKFWSGLNASLSYLCKNGKQTYLKFYKCFSQPRFESSIRTCNRTLHMKKAAGEFSEDLYCQLENEFLQCITENTSRHCGKDAARFENTVVQRMKQPFMDLRDCTLASSIFRINLLLLITTLLLHTLLP